MTVPRSPSYADWIISRRLPRLPTSSRGAEIRSGATPLSVGANMRTLTVNTFFTLYKLFTTLYLLFTLYLQKFCKGKVKGWSLTSLCTVHTTVSFGGPVRRRKRHKAMGVFLRAGIEPATLRLTRIFQLQSYALPTELSKDALSL